MLNITIDNKAIEVAEDTTVLAAATKAGVDIPTLCYNEELTPAGACRLCVVEVIKNGESILLTSCDNYVTDGMVVHTNSPRATGARRIAAEVLLAQNPTSEKLRHLARCLEIEAPRGTLPSQECILCRQCVRACQEVVETGAVSFISRVRGREAEPKVVFDAERCIACGSCSYVCPTEAVKLVDRGRQRTITTPSGKMEFNLKACGKCGAYFAPEKQLVYMAKKSGLPQEKFDLCLNCRE